MKKIKVIFPDGSTGEVEESQLKAAISAGARRVSDNSIESKNKSTTVVFPDGSMGDIEDSKLDNAIKAGAVKKKDGGNGTSVGSDTSLNGSAQSISPLQEDDDSLLSSAKDVFDVSSYIKTPKVNVSGIEVALTNIPTQVPDRKPNPERYATDLQQRINTKTFNTEDVDVVAKSMKVSPQAASAYLQGKAATGSVIHFNDVKAEKNIQLINAVESANLQLGLDDNFDDVFKTAESAGAYIQKIEKLYEDKANRESVASVQKAIKDNPIAYTEGFGQGLVDDSQSKETLNAAQEIKAIVSNDIIDKVTTDGTLSKDEKVKKIYKLSDNRDYKNVEKAISDRLSPFRAMMGVVTGDNTFEEIELLNSTKAGLEFKLNKSIKDKIDYNKAVVQSVMEGATVEQDNSVSFSKEQQQIVDAANAENALLLQQYVPEKEIIEKYPVLFKTALASAANEYNALKSGNVEGYEDGRFENITLEEHLKANGFDVNDQKVKDFLRGRVLRGDNLKDYDFFGRPLQNIAEVFINTAKSVGDLTGIRSEASILADKKQDELFPRNVSENDELKLTSTASAFQNIGNTTGQVIGQGLLQYATAGLGRMAGLSKIASTNSAFWSSGTLTSYDAAHKDSYDFLDNGLARTAYAGLIALANGASEKIFPEIKLFQIPGVKDAISEISKKVGTKELTKELAEELLGKAKNAFVDYATKYSKNVGQETIEEVSTDLFESGTRFIFGDPNISVAKAIENAKNTAIQTAMGTSLIGGFGAHKDVQNERNTSAKATIYNSAVYYDEALDAINKGLKENLYSQAERDLKIKTLNTAKNAVTTMRQTEQIEGKELTRPQRELYVANLTAEAMLKGEKANIDDEVIGKSIDEKISNLQNQRKQILNGEANIDDDGNIIVAEAQATAAPTSQQAESKESVTQDKTTPAEATVAAPVIMKDLMKQELSFEQKYKEIEFNDPILNENKKMTAKSARTLMEKRHNILDKIVNCLT